MKISLITATYNNAATIVDCLESVNTQTVKPFEHIIIDGQSTDGTLEILANYKHLKVLSEPDKGIYDALNKGIRLANGDIIGFMHADDFYANNQVLAWVNQTFEQAQCDAVYGDLQYVQANNIKKIVRNWKAGEYKQKKIKWGWMPPHPTLFVKKSVYEKFGNFDLSYTIAADYELMMRFLWKHNISLVYIPKLFINMRTGGKSNRWLNIYLKMKEDYRAIRSHHIGGLKVLIFKNLRKIEQFF
ncbi:MAG: glycosyltransferase [Bacteroidales bacterium]|nr:glycosyltransferase [Bacteroidales bacterium]